MLIATPQLQPTQARDGFEMTDQNFYDNWLGLWDKSVEERKKARKVIHSDELQWVRTRQDYKTALMVAPETGFRTWGGATMIAEIPSGWHTGSHSHGEEAIYILGGKGFSIIDDRQYEWEEGACIHIPFGAVHQHFNEGNEPVKYLSALSPSLEFFCGVCKFEQYEDCGEMSGKVTKVNASTTGLDPSGSRLVLHKRDMATTYGGEDLVGIPYSKYHESVPEEARKRMFNGDKNAGMHKISFRLMSSRSDFVGEEAEMTHVFVDPPGALGGKHAHMEAILYVIEGEGYSELDGENYSWRKGSSVHIQGPQTVHMNANSGTTDTHVLRIHFGMRSMYFQRIAKRTFPYVFYEPRRESA